MMPVSANVQILYPGNSLFTGALLIDEMKISPRATFDKHSMKLSGFTDLGKYTPQKDRDKLGDHALVILFQPFQGHWFQAVGSFLSRGCATGDIR